MTTKEYLSQARWLDKQINSNLELLSELKSRAESFPAVNLSGDKVQSGQTIDRVADIVIKIVDLEKTIDAQIDKYVDLKKEIKEKIDAIDNIEYRIILQERYLNFKKWEQIAVDLNYAYRHVLRLHGEALKKIY